MNDETPIEKAAQEFCDGAITAEDMVNRTVAIANKNYKEWRRREDIDEMSERAHRIAGNIYNLFPDRMRGSNNLLMTKVIAIAIDKELPRKSWLSRLFRGEHDNL